ncbi:threonine transporter RhtB [Roseibium aquae]|uniref:Threonine transporter RhtB n=1 Tax=Roseibium aquae TaxID=1323746 RepID=A0A916TM70_9HYPH|nr:LysE family translocator [Roseibium aquae]GGB56065.1 threonine transporter RhtB [Roseibium aquae]
MIPIDVLSVFFVAALALGAAPGPDNLFVLTQSALHGRMAGFVVTLGLCSGLLVHTAAVALGVAAIFETSAAAFTALKVLGAGYLLYLAIGAWRAGATGIGNGAAPKLPLAALYRRGIVMNVTNPKVAIFFLAFLPQFADPAHGSVALQIGLLGVVFIAATVMVFGAVALFGGTIGGFLRKADWAHRALNRAASLVFAGLAARLLLTER